MNIIKIMKEYFIQYGKLDALLVFITTLAVLHSLRWVTFHYWRWIWSVRLSIDNLHLYNLNALTAPKLQTLRILNIAASSNGYSHDSSDILGIGTSGTVVVRHDMSNHATFVAMKRFHCNNENEIDHAIEEIKTHKRATGPNVVSVLGYAYTLSADARKLHQLCLITEFCAAGSMEEYILRSTKPLPEHQLLLWISQIAKALRHIHRAGIVNGDVKAANILITEQFEARLSDFGSAVSFSKDNRFCQGFYGTPEYDPPEILSQTCDASQRIFTKKVDSWGLGCVMFELMTSQPLQGVLAKKNLSEYMQRIPTRFTMRSRSVLTKLLEPNPVLRYSPSAIRKYISGLAEDPSQYHCSGPRRLIEKKQKINAAVRHIIAEDAFSSFAVAALSKEDPYLHVMEKQPLMDPYQSSHSIPSAPIVHISTPDFYENSESPLLHNEEAIRLPFPTEHEDYPATAHSLSKHELVNSDPSQNIPLSTSACNELAITKVVSATKRKWKETWEVSQCKKVRTT